MQAADRLERQAVHLAVLESLRELAIRQALLCLAFELAIA